MTTERRRNQIKEQQQRFRRLNPFYNAWQCWNGSLKDHGLDPISFETYKEWRQSMPLDKAQKINCRWSDRFFVFLKDNPNSSPKEFNDTKPLNSHSKSEVKKMNKALEERKVTCGRSFFGCKNETTTHGKISESHWAREDHYGIYAGVFCDECWEKKCESYRNYEASPEELDGDS